MITEIYNAITDAIKAIDGVLIKHIDLWNQNVEFIEEDEPWDRPAVFVEFGEIAWEPYKGPVKGVNGKGEILLHIVTDWKGSAADGSQHKEETLQDYELSTAIYAALHDLEGEHFRITSLGRTLTNHNHQELLENIEVYNVTYAREL